MRKFLITKFVCSKCGKNLELTYDYPPISGRYEDGEPTGAEKVQQLIGIVPCYCVTKKLDEMKNAAKILLGSD